MDKILVFAVLLKKVIFIITNKSINNSTELNIKFIIKLM